MKLIILFILVTLIMIAPLGNAFSESGAEGYSRSDGIYAAPYRSSPGRSYNNNWSVEPDYNLYKAERETRSSIRDDHYYERNYQRWWK